MSMFIAMNRFKVLKGAEHDFEQVWLTRDSHLRELDGFIVFHLLKGPEREDHVLYSSHTMWRSHADFEAWTKSEQFRKAHARAGGDKAALRRASRIRGLHRAAGRARRRLAARGRQSKAAQSDMACSRTSKQRARPLAARVAASPGDLLGADRPRVRRQHPRSGAQSAAPSSVAIVSGEAFADIMQDITTWGEILFLDPQRRHRARVHRHPAGRQLRARLLQYSRRHRNTGAPIAAMTMPIGSSAGRTTMRAAMSATSTSAAPSSALPGSTTR